MRGGVLAVAVGVMTAGPWGGDDRWPLGGRALSHG